jgi:hypothetical protein
LEPFKVHSNTMRTEAGRGKGYSLDDLEPLFSRYLPDLSVTTGQPAESLTFSVSQSVTRNDVVTDKRMPEAAENKACHGVTDEKGGKGRKGQVTDKTPTDREAAEADLQERIAIMIADGGLSELEARRRLKPNRNWLM